MKSIFTIIISLMLLTQSAVAQNRFSDLFAGSGSSPTHTPNNPIASLGPFAVGYSFCQKLQALSPILQAYSTVMWPVIGIPGITTGMVQNESVLFKICDYLTQLQQLDTSGAIFHSARFLNELTGQKWNDHLNQADLMWNTANMIYDVKGNGGYRKGALRSAYVHKALIDAADKTAKYWQKQNGDPDPEGIESRQERQRKLQRVAQLSYNRAILSEATSCPEPKMNKNYAGEYQQKVIPEQANIRRVEDRIRFFQEMLMKMGADMIIDVAALQKYKDDVLALPGKGFNFVKEDAVSYVEREAPTGKIKAKTGNAPGMPEAEYKTVKDAVPYQRVTSIINPEPWDKMRVYEKQWERYITNQMLVSGTYGLFDGKKGRIEEKYRSYAFECSETQLAPTLPITDRNNSRYYTELKKEQDLCRSRLKLRDGNDKEMKNLMERYVQMMRDDIMSGKDSQAKIWTLESLYTKTYPVQEDTPNNSRATQDQAKNQMKLAQSSEEACRPQFTPGEMDKLNLELQNTNNALLEEVVITGTERSVANDIERDAKFKAAEDQQKREDMMNQKILNSKESGSATPSIKADTRGSL